MPTHILKLNYGIGDGFADGYGSGNGSGFADGYGDGDGDGSGYGYGSGSYWLSCMSYFAAKWPESAQSRYRELAAKQTKFAYWRSNADGRPANGGSGVIAEPGAIHKERGPLNLCHRGTLHATLLPIKWQGDRWWIVALHGEVVGDDEKFGCLEREIIGECL